MRDSCLPSAPGHPGDKPELPGVQVQWHEPFPISPWGNFCRQPWPDGFCANTFPASSSQPGVQLFTQMHMTEGNQGIPSPHTTPPISSPGGAGLIPHHHLLVSLESTFHSLAPLTDHTAKTSFKEEHGAGIGQSNFRLKCCITRVDFESLITKTFNTLTFHKSGSKLRSSVFNAPGTRLCEPHLPES